MGKGFYQVPIASCEPVQSFAQALQSESDFNGIFKMMSEVIDINVYWLGRNSYK